MKKIFCLFMLVCTLKSFAQNDSTATVNKPYVTPAGKPFGNIVSAKMNNTGGKLISADKGLEVIVPADALDSEMNISIQSVHNELNENDEGAYQLKPSGVHFKKPVQLIFHFSDENADIKSIAWQDNIGQWRYFRNIMIDSILKTVSCLAPHFSQWSRFDKIYLSPSSALLKANKTLSLHLVSLEDIRARLGEEVSSAASESTSATSSSATTNGDYDGDLLAAPHATHYYTGEWTVNGIVNGNSEVGVVNRQNNRNAIYKAPAVAPDNNPVAASVQIYSNNNQKKLLLTSNITIVNDQYNFSYIIYSFDGCFHMIDSSSCVLNFLRHRISASNIRNYEVWSDWPPSCDGCTWEWTNKVSLKGLVEITGIASSQITPPANEGAPTNVKINFSPAMGSTASAKVTCPGGPQVSVPSQPNPAMPRSINFDIDGDDVIIHGDRFSGRNQLVIGTEKHKTVISIHKIR